jgi:GTP-binding protein EngB required for normal cell division
MKAARRTPPLPERLAALDEVLDAGRGRLDADRLAAAAAVRHKANERLARGEGVVVAALCGGTGTGKSSLLNALAGADVAAVGVRRPVTTDPLALVVGDPDPAGALLDWLEVPERYLVASDGLPDGLVLVDLPDMDSVAAGHRATVDRFVERVDVLVWVVDPIKYAQRALHHDYLRALAAHAEVVVLVLNRIDELPVSGRRACLDDLRRLLAREGLGSARILATSARTGEGIDDLAQLLSQETRRRRAVGARLTGDVRRVASGLRAEVGESSAAEPDPAPLVAALGAAVGVNGVAALAGETYRRDARAGSRSLLVWWLPLLLVALAGPWRGAQTRLRRRLERRPETGRPATGAAPMRAEHALWQTVESYADGLPRRWRRRFASVAAADPAAVAEAVSRAVDRVSLRPGHRRWWTLVRWSASLFEALALVGFFWLVLAGVVAWLQLPPLPTPTAVGPLSWPTLLLGGGLVLRLLLALVQRSALRRGAERHRGEVSAELHQAVETVVSSHVLEPLREERRMHDRLRDLLDLLAR